MSDEGSEAPPSRRRKRFWGDEHQFLIPVSADQRDRQPRGYGSWKADEEALLTWMEQPANSALVRGAGKIDPLTGKLNIRKAELNRKISRYLKQHGINRDAVTVKNKLLHLEKGYREALNILSEGNSECDDLDTTFVSERMEDDETRSKWLLNIAFFTSDRALRHGLIELFPYGFLRQARTALGIL